MVDDKETLEPIFNLDFDEPLKVAIEKTLVEERRTRLKAGAVSINVDNIDEYSRIPTIIQDGYRDGMSFYSANPESVAHLVSLTNAPEYKDGILYFENLPFSRAIIKELSTNKDIDKIDLPLLKVLYLVILKDFLDKNKNRDYYEATNNEEIVRIYVPDLAHILEKDFSLNKKTISSLIDAVSSFQNIIGVMKEKVGDKEYKSILPVLVFIGYEEKTNTIRFTSPYMTELIKTIYKASLRQRSLGELMAIEGYNDDDSYSDIIHSSIAKEKNKTAVEIVTEVVKILETTESGSIPMISAETLIRHVPQLVERLNRFQEREKYPRGSQNKALKRAFTKAWELLSTKTDLRQQFSNIIIPDPTDPQMIPTMTNMYQLVFQFSMGPLEKKKKSRKKTRG